MENGKICTTCGRLVKRQVTASNLNIFLQCQWGYRADVHVPHSDPPGKAARLGTAVHAVAEGVPLADVLAKYPDVDGEDVAAHAEIYHKWRAQVERDKAGSRLPWIQEKAFAYDAVTGKVREVARPTECCHQYDISDTEAAGTLDLLLIKDDKVLIGDLKTGQGLKTVDDYEAQVMFGAICATKFYGKATAFGFINHISTQIRSGQVVKCGGLDFTSEEGVLVTRRVFESAEMADMEERLKAGVLAVPYSRPLPGSHCKWCRAAPVCPTNREAFAALGPSSAIVRPGYNSGLIDKLRTPEEATRMYEFVGRAEKLLDMANALLRDYATNVGPVEVGDGKVWGQFDRSSSSINLEKALPVLQEHLGSRYTEALDVKVTQAGIKRLLETMDKPKSAAAMVKLKEALQSAGALVEKTSKSFTEKKLLK